MKDTELIKAVCPACRTTIKSAVEPDGRLCPACGTEMVRANKNLREGNNDNE